MKRRISLFFLTISVALMMGHNLIPHCHHGHIGEDSGTIVEHTHDHLHAHEGLLGSIFSTVAHNHAGMLFFEHLVGDVTLEKKSKSKASIEVRQQTLLIVFAVPLAQLWAPLPPDFHFSNHPEIRGLRAPPLPA